MTLPKFEVAQSLLISIALILAIAGAAVNWWRVSALESRIDQLPSTTSQQLAEQPSASLPSVDTVAVTSKLDLLDQRVASVEQKLTQIKDSAISKAPVKTTALPAREYIIYLGSGNTVNRDWTNISAAGVTLDLSKYRNIREIRFEAALSIINGEAHARLYDQTASNIFYNSEVSHNTSTGEWKTSQALTLAAGTHYYNVQLLSTSGEQANLEGSRLKILAD